jgi:hypothetical protein
VTLSDVPAGWYPNPADDGVSERYWDGRLWTEHTRERPPESPESPESSGSSDSSDVSDEESIPPGWYPDPDTDGATARFWDGNDWTDRTRASVRPTPGPRTGGASAGGASTGGASTGGVSASTASASTASTSTASTSTEPVSPSPVSASSAIAPSVEAQLAAAVAPEPQPLAASIPGPAVQPDSIAQPTMQDSIAVQAAPVEAGHTEVHSVADDEDEDDEEIPAGWYPDPDDGGISARYWDGNDWTERTRSAVRPSPGPGQDTAANPLASQDGHRDHAAELPVADHGTEVADPSSPTATSDSADDDKDADDARPEPVVLSKDAEPTVAEPQSVLEPGASAEPEASVEAGDEPQDAGEQHASAAEGDLDAEEPVVEAEPVVEPEPAAAEAESESESAAAEAEASDDGGAGEVLDTEIPPSAPTVTPTATPTATTTPRRPSPGPGVKLGGSAARQPVPSSAASVAQREGFNPLQRLRGIRKKDEPVARAANPQWAPDGEAADAYRQLEFNRLDLLLGAVWEEAMNGDVASVQAATKLIEMRCRLVGLDVGNASGEAAPPPMLVNRDDRPGQQR